MLIVFKVLIVLLAIVLLMVFIVVMAGLITRFVVDPMERLLWPDLFKRPAPTAARETSKR